MTTLLLPIHIWLSSISLNGGESEYFIGGNLWQIINLR